MFLDGDDAFKNKKESIQGPVHLEKTNETLFPELIHIDSLGLGVGTHDLANLDDQISVFPNPTSGPLTITIDDAISLDKDNCYYTLTSMDGTQSITGKITGHVMSVEVSNLVPGTYLLSLELNNQFQYVKKIVRIP